VKHRSFWIFGKGFFLDKVMSKCLVHAYVAKHLLDKEAILRLFNLVLKKLDA